MADRIGAPLDLNVTRWERATAWPSAYYVQRLCELFGKSVSELGLLSSQPESAVGSQPEPTHPLNNLPEGTVTLLFTKLDGSASILQQLGDRYTDVLKQCRYLLRAEVVQYNGHDVGTQGDTFSQLLLVLPMRLRQR